MSTEDNEILLFLQSTWVQYSTYATISLLWYDYALTFSDEVKYMWKRPFRLSTLLYICCRYALVANVLFLVCSRDLLSPSCDSWYKFIGALSTTGRAAVIITLIGRTYAVYGKNKFVLLVLVPPGLACVILDLMHISNISCIPHAKSPIVSILRAVMISSFEFIATALTITRTIQAVRVEMRIGATWRQQTKSLMYLVAEQGILYFIVISIFTTTAVVVNLKSPGGFVIRFLNASTLPLSGMLTARFLLHIRSWGSSSNLFTDDSTFDDKYMGKELPHAYKQTRKNSDDTLINEPQTSTILTTTASAIETFMDVDDFGEDPVKSSVRRQTVVDFKDYDLESAFRGESIDSGDR